MEIISYWVIVSIFTFNMPTYGGKYIPSENRISLPFEHKTKKSCERVASAMFKSMKKEETKDDPQKLKLIYCAELSRYVNHDRSLQNRTQGNGSRSVPDS